MMTREQLIDKRDELLKTRAKLIADANACKGAIEMIDQILSAEAK